MSGTLVECVPNFSEGRDSVKVDAIVAALLSVPGVALLDREMDTDHNRCVITIVGPLEAVGEAALRGAGKAAELIDLTKHTGAHPRIGATDVIPFIPIEGVKLADCVELAKQVAEQLWKRHQIPAYLYEAAAARPGRTNLENIRQGQFEGLSEEIETDPDRAPDFGEAKLHPTAGATVVGARKFLIAYNVNLNTSDVSIAKKVAKAVRFSSGGLRFVKGMGVDLKARKLAQVSMNLTDYEKTPVFRAFEMVKREAARYGASPVGSEIVGLIPKGALEATSDFYLQLEDFDPQQQILENRLAAVMAEQAGRGLASLAEGFVRAVSEPTATPGGGSCAALSGALAAGLGQMVASVSAKKKSLAEHKEMLIAHADRLGALRQQLTAAIDSDATAFDAVMAAFKLPKSSEPEKKERTMAIEEATRGATEVPLEVARAAAEALTILTELDSISSPSMTSDRKTGLALAVAAIRGALENVALNLEGLSDDQFKKQVQEQTKTLEARIQGTV